MPVFYVTIKMLEFDSVFSSSEFMVSVAPPSPGFRTVSEDCNSGTLLSSIPCFVLARAC